VPAGSVPIISCNKGAQWTPCRSCPIAAAHSTEEKLRAYWTMKGAPPADRQERLLTKLAEVEKAALSS
jgi:hypothetical protein